MKDHEDLRTTLSRKFLASYLILFVRENGIPVTTSKY